MINLIPPDAQKQVKREYWVRVFSVWSFLVGSALLMVIVFHIPAYVLIQNQLLTYLEEFNDATNKSQTMEDSKKVIERANRISEMLAKPNITIPFSKVVADIEEVVGEGIRVEGYTFNRLSTGITPIVVTGKAETRAGLSAFRDALEANSYFKTVTLPLSDLAKDSDIEFSITITPHIDKKVN